MPFTFAERFCPICRTNDAASLLAEANYDPSKLDEFAFASRKTPEYMHWRLWECDRCDLVFANPAPPAEQLGMLYQDAAFSSSKEAALASRTYAAVLRKKVTPRLEDRVGALDIGTGDGVFLQHLLDGGYSEVSGIEPSLAPIESADARVAALIRKGLFEANVFAAEQFRLVTCFQTIEHVPDPLGLCREALHILKPGGAVLLIAHNRRALSAKVLGSKSPIFDIEHLQLFSPTSIHNLLHTAGFKRIEVFPIFNRYPISYWMQLLPIGKLKPRAIAFMNWVRMGNLPIPLPAGNMAAVGFK